VWSKALLDSTCCGIIGITATYESISDCLRRIGCFGMAWIWHDTLKRMLSDCNVVVWVDYWTADALWP
jgi:hypothetical protein